MNLSDWLPIPPWQGPPLPRWTGACWPWLQGGSRLPSLSNIFAGPSSDEAPAPTSTYNNIEEIEFPDGFDPATLMPRRIVVHRNAKVTNG